MSRVIWSEPAVEGLRLIREPRILWQVIRALRSLAMFPRRGRIPPEVAEVPEASLPGELREIIFPELARVFYIYDEHRDAVRILGIRFRGQEVTGEWILRLTEE